MQALTRALLVVSAISLSSCQPVASPLIGNFYNDVKFGNFATSISGATKEGKACASTILALFASGDASIEAAKQQGGITEISYIDHTSKSILGVWAEFCTIVKGK